VGSENNSENDKEDFTCEFCEEEFETEKELKKHRRLEHERKTCSQCGKKLSQIPSECNYCGETFCTEHRLPENHSCIGLEEETKSDDKVMFMNSKENDSKAEMHTSEAPSTSQKSSSEFKGKIPDFKNPVNPNSLKRLLPLIGILLLVGIYGSSSPDGVNSVKDVQQLGVDQKLVDAYESLKDSVQVEDKTKLGATFIFIVTIWSGFKYWLKDIRIIRRNSDLLEKVLTIIILITIFERHIALNSALGHYADWAIFLMTVYVEIAGSWFLAKTIDGIDLSSDLYCWGLRILGITTMIFGGLLLTSSSFVALNSDLVFNNIYWIGSVCLIGLGAFMEYRSFRRHPAVHVW